MARLARNPLQLFGVGTPKSGTTSLAGVFEKNYRAQREPEHFPTSALLDDWQQGQLSESELARVLVERHHRLNLQLESSHLLSEFSPQLTRLFPAAKFILTLRDPFSWLDSMLNSAMNARTSNGSYRTRWFEILFRPQLFEYSKEEAVLRERGLFPLQAYLTYWSRVTQCVLDSVPSRRLLVLPTELRERLPELAQFAGVPLKTLTPSQAHRNETQVRHGIVGLLDSGFARNSFDRFSTPIRARYFPDANFDGYDFCRRSPEWLKDVHQLAKRLGEDPPP